MAEHDFPEQSSLFCPLGGPHLLNSKPGVLSKHLLPFQELLWKRLHNPGLPATFRAFQIAPVTQQQAPLWLNLMCAPNDSYRGGS